MTELPKLVLASQSPRRAEILSNVGWRFEKQIADIDETELPGENPADYVRRLAQIKAETVAEKRENAMVLGADTIVVIDGRIIGKPKDFEDARRMLKMLSGRWHEVLTGVAIAVRMPNNENSPPVQTSVGLQKTRVKFDELSDADIKFLIEKGEPLDKAGAYAVQAQAALFIEEIEGDYWNVVGLPVNLVYKLVKDQTQKGRD